MSKKQVVIYYTNHKNETRYRKVIPTGKMLFEANEWHKESQWLMVALDVEKNEIRHFAMKDISGWLPMEG